MLIAVGLYRIISLRNNNKYYLDLEIKTSKYIYMDNERGKIYDRNGKLIVGNTASYTITYQKPSNINYKNEIEIATKLLELIEFDLFPKELEIKKYYILTNKDITDKLITDEEYQLYEKRKLNSEDLYNLKLERIKDINYDENELKVIKLYFLMNDGYSYDIKTIKNKDVSKSEYAKVLESGLPGISGYIDYVRVYPYENTLRTILGTVKEGLPKEDKDYYLDLGYSLNDKVGYSYLEKQYELLLQGEKSVYKVNNDNSLSLVKEGKKGQDIYLSIDIDLQLKTDEIIKKYLIDSVNKENTEYFNHAYVIVSDPNTGEILVLSGMQIIKNKKDYSFVDIANRSISSSYTMGSSIKGASIAVGYNNGLIEPDKKILDKCIKLKSVPLKCSFNKELGRIDDIEAITYSSNSYQYQLAIKLTNSKYIYNGKINSTQEHFDIYRHTFASYGLGTLTGIDLPNEQVGIISDKVSDDLLLNFSIGQLDNYTPIQMSQYINTIANGGARLKLNLLKDNGITTLNKVSISDDNMNRIKMGLRNVVLKGTGVGIVPKTINAAAKTGTSESMLDVDGDNKVDVSTITRVFAMYAPYDNPKYSMVVITPDISHNYNENNYSYPTNVKISRAVAQKLFEIK